VFAPAAEFAAVAVASHGSRAVNHADRPCGLEQVRPRRVEDPRRADRRHPAQAPRGRRPLRSPLRRCPRPGQSHDPSRQRPAPQLERPTAILSRQCHLLADVGDATTHPVFLGRTYLRLLENLDLAENYLNTRLPAPHVDYQRRARELVQRRVGVPVQSVIEKSKGMDHRVFLVKTNRGWLVVRFPLEKGRLWIHAWASLVWRSRGVTVPKTIAYDCESLIEERIVGLDIEDAALRLDRKRRVLFELGSMMRRMHTVKTRGFGELAQPGCGEVGCWRDYLSVVINGKIKALRRSRSPPRVKRVIEAVGSFCARNRSLLECDSPRLVHKDLFFGNIMVEGGRLSGIVDLSAAISGDPLFDLGAVFLECDQEDLADQVFRGYGRVDPDKLRYYALVHAMRRIHAYSICCPRQAAVRLALRRTRSILEAFRR